MIDTAALNDEEFLSSMGSLVDDRLPTEEAEPEVIEEVETEEVFTEETEQEPDTEEAEETGSLSDEDFEEDFSTGSKEEPESGPEEEPEKTEPVVEKQSGDLQHFFAEVTAPFRANGTEIQVKTAADVRSLMQMGANFTKKMQEIAPYRKALVTLENNKLLDADKINFLVDLYNKKPEAIKQLLKDSELSAYDLDLDDEDAPQYVPEDHSPSDQELALRETLETLRTLPGGESTIIDVTKTWDTESKNVLWDNPGLLSTIHSQKQNGIYDTITREIERRQVLGQLPAHLPFVNAYQAVGEELDSAGAFDHLVQGQGQPSKSAPVAVTKGKVNNAAQNGDRAKAASISRGNSKHTNRIVDLTELDDDKFLQAMSKII